MGGSYEEVLNEGREENMLECLRNLMANVGMTMEQAMDALGVPEAKRPIYKKELQV